MVPLNAGIMVVGRPRRDRKEARQSDAPGKNLVLFSSTS